LKYGKLLFRSWFYFRVGYNTYLTFLVGYGSTLVTVYYLAIRNVQGLQELFPRFLTFGALATAVGLPLSVAIGWIHVKRSQAWRSELDISVEANPYYYRLAPGHTTEVFTPINKEMLLAVRDLLKREGLIDPERSKRLDDLLEKLDLLLKGGYVGRPRARL
jgi:hypothetical protein